MANQVAPRLAGDDYQHLYAWWQALGLFVPRLELAEVWIEDERAGSFDDITLHYAPTARRASQFVQVKYHVDQRASYSTAILIDRQGNNSSLLQKFWRTWKSLQKNGDQPEITLFSNWGWDSTDKVGECIDGGNGSIKNTFLTEGPQSGIGKLRAQWMTECGGTHEDFAAFISSLRLLLGSSNAAVDVSDRVAERMSHLNLQYDESALLLASGIVRDWIKRGVQKLTRESLNAVIDKHDLRAKPKEPAVTVYLETIKKRRFDLDPDYLLDWRHYFSGPAHEKGHAVIDRSAWNGEMLPALHQLEERINLECAPKLIRARGLSRLSAWFAFGKVFSRVGGYVIEVQQGLALWRTDAAPSQDFALRAIPIRGAGERAAALAVGLNVTGSLTADMETYLNDHAFVGGILSLEPVHGPSRDVFRSAGDVVSFTNQAKRAIRQWIDETGAADVLLFYFGPLSGACFLGHDLNAIGARVTVMEDQSPGYAESFRL